MEPAYPALSEYIDLLLDAICVVDTEGRYVYVSAGFERIFGYAPEEVMGRRMIELVHPDDRERTLKRAGEIMSGGPDYHFENRYVRKDGQVVDIMWSARWSEDHKLRIAVARDVTRRKHAETIQHALYAISEATHAAEDLGTLYQQIHRIIGDLLPASNFSIALYDEKTGEISVPYHVDDRAPSPASQKLHADTLCAQVIRSGQPLLLTPDDVAGAPVYSGELSQARVGDHSRSWLGVPLTTPKGTIGALMVQSDVGSAPYTRDDQELLQFVSHQIAAAIERKQTIASLQQTALYDRLTQLPNRALFHDRMQLALARVRRDQVQLSLLYIDLDKFKDVNDTFGHATGDLLLQGIARRLEDCVRAGDTVARFGGDEFVVLLENVGIPDHTTSIIEKIRKALSAPFDLAGQLVYTLASIGVAHCPLHGDDEKQLLAHADADMYRQKRTPE
ncbi:MAG TPA: diguanylate cyclase [Burkholderiales bacterium]|nr:diguanylate cyclase [Burkholderiales bacterium]